MSRTNRSEIGSLSCSFCHKSQKAVGKLISSPSDYPRAYICDECIAVCAAILEDDRPGPPVADPSVAEETHPLLNHPQVSQLLTAVVDWIRQESLGKDGAEELALLRSLAARMIAGGPGGL